MTESIEYHFVVSRAAGLLDLGLGRYSVPLARGEVVYLCDPNTRGPDGKLFPSVGYVVEQIVHRLGHRLPVTDRDAVAHPVPVQIACPLVYLSLLDESGSVAPYERGPVPGLRVVPAENRARTESPPNRD